jgi:hypothetical protein
MSRVLLPKGRRGGALPQTIVTSGFGMNHSPLLRRWRAAGAALWDVSKPPAETAVPRHHGARPVSDQPEREAVGEVATHLSHRAQKWAIAAAVTPGDREASFELLDGVALRGGYLGLSAGEGEDPEDRDIDIYQTILSGDIGIPEFNLDNSYHVVTDIQRDETAVLSAFEAAPHCFLATCRNGVPNFVQKTSCRRFPRPASTDLFNGVARNFQASDPPDLIAKRAQYFPVPEPAETVWSTA